MRAAGAILMVLGGLLALIAFATDTSLSTSGTSIAGEQLVRGWAYGLGLLQRQMMVFQGGLAMFLAGAFLYGSSSPRFASTTMRFVDVREDDTDKEREQRVRRQRRRNLIIAVGVIALVLLFAAGMMWPSFSHRSSTYMNLDENLTVTDRNAVDKNLAGRDGNAF